MTMNFEYRGKLKGGGKAKGLLEAESREGALNLLQEQGVLVLSLKELSTANKAIRFKKKLKNADFVMFLRQFATLIDAGISVSEGVKTMAAQVSNPSLKEALVDIDQQIDRGERLSVAASRHEKIFPELLVHMMEAGEASGRLDEILQNMAGYYEKSYKNKRKLMGSLIYPASVGIMAILMTAFILVVVVPSFADMFTSIGAEIPAYTRFIMGLSDFLQKFWWLILAVIAVIGVAFKYAMKNEKFAYKFDGLSLKLPMVGNLLHKSALVRMTHSLSLLINASIPILQALEIVEKVVPNRVIRGIIPTIRTTLASGGEMSRVMAGHWVFPPLMIQMVQVGEKTGGLDRMLEKVSGFYEDEVDDLSARFGALIEPVLIVFLAVVVGGIVMAIIIPMFSMYDSF